MSWTCTVRQQCVLILGLTVCSVGTRLSRAGPLDPLTLDLYPDYGVFTLYEDDGHSFEYEQGQFCTTSYRLRRTEDRLVFEIGAREGAYAPPARRLLIRVHAVGEQAVEGYPGASYDPDRRMLTLQVDDDGSSRTLSF